MTSRFILEIMDPAERSLILGQEIARIQKEIEAAEAQEEAEWEREIDALYGVEEWISRPL